MSKYLIVGNGPAGAAAAKAIHETDEHADITIFSSERAPYYYRPRLPEYIAGQASLDRFTLQDETWYAQRGIKLELGVEVTKIDLEERFVSTSLAREYPFASLLLAPGAHCFVPPVAGAEKQGVFTLRTVEDAEKIRQAAQEAKKAVLVGGGLLGLEAGFGLSRLGLEVQVVEFFDRLLPRQLDGPAAAILGAILEEKGFRFWLGAKASQVLGGERAEGLELSGGERLSGSLVLFSAGVRPNLELAKTAGLEINRGVVVDDQLRTSAPGVWAAGDVAEHAGVVYGIWPAAMAQGRQAGLSMAGAPARYAGTTVSNTLKVAGVDLTCAGEIDAQGEFESRTWSAPQAYRKIVLDQGRVVGLIFLGVKDGLAQCLKALEKGVDVSEHIPDLDRLDFDFNRLLA